MGRKGEGLAVLHFYTRNGAVLARDRQTVCITTSVNVLLGEEALDGCVDPFDLCGVRANSRVGVSQG